MTKYKIHKFNDANELAVFSATLIAKELEKILSIQERAFIALSGGSTPSQTYKILSETKIEWNRINVFLGDDRFVDSNNENSNDLMINRTLLSSFPGSEANFYPIPVSDSNSTYEAANRFSDLLKSFFNQASPIFDITLLGLGDDGHTASLFPGTESLYEEEKIATVSNGKGLQRVTLTAPVISSSKTVIFMVSGEGKKKALERLLDPKEPFQRTPAKLIQPESDVIILTDIAI